MKKTTALIGSTLLAVAASGMVSACGLEPPPPGSTIDYSNKSAPKTIQSKDITSFSYTFYDMGRVAILKSLGGDFVPIEDDNPFQGRCAFKLVHNGEKADFNVSCSSDIRFSGEPQKPLQFSGTVGKEALEELQAIIEKHNVAQLNGFYKRNSALGHYFDLRVNYASGESIIAGGEGGISVLPDGGLPGDAFSQFFKQLIQQTGQAIPSNHPPASSIRHFELSFVNNHPEEGFPAGRYLMQYFHIDGKKGKEYVYASYESAESVQKTVFKTDFRKEEVQALQSLIDRENLIALSGYSLQKPELGDQKFAMEISFENRRLLKANAVGDKNVLPSKYWNGGKSFVDFFHKVAAKHGKVFP